MKVIKKQIEQINLSPYNPRKNLCPGDVEYEALKKSIMEFGCVLPLVWNEKTNNIIGGEQTFKVLKDLGYKQVDVVAINTDEISEKALNLALNKIDGKWDQNKLSVILKEFMDVDFDIELTGFDMQEIEQITNSISFIDDLMQDDFIDKLSETDVFSITFLFPKKDEEKILTHIKRLGKDRIVKDIIDAAYTEGGSNYA